MIWRSLEDEVDATAIEHSLTATLIAMVILGSFYQLINQLKFPRATTPLRFGKD